MEVATVGREVHMDSLGLVSRLQQAGIEAAPGAVPTIETDLLARYLEPGLAVALHEVTTADVSADHQFSRARQLADRFAADDVEGALGFDAVHQVVQLSYRQLTGYNEVGVHLGDPAQPDRVPSDVFVFRQLLTKIVSGTSEVVQLEQYCRRPTSPFLPLLMMTGTARTAAAMDAIAHVIDGREDMFISLSGLSIFGHTLRRS